MVSMDRSTTDVVGGALLAENAGAALEEIEQVSSQIASLVQNISNSAREQAGAADSVMRIVEVLQEINAQAASGTNMTRESISNLAALAAQLRHSAAGFRLPPQDMEAHRARLGAPSEIDEPAPSPAVEPAAAFEDRTLRIIGKRTA
jgi:twitching motility protein PilJ